MQKKQYSLKELTQDLDVTIQGDSGLMIEGVCTIQQAQPNHITFLVNPLYKKYLATTKAASVILSANDASDSPVTTIISKNPYFTYAKIATFFDNKPYPEIGIHESAIVGQHCHIDPTARVGAHVVIGNHVKIGARVVLNPGCTIGDGSYIEDDTYLYANVSVYHNVKIGKRVMIASGAVLGSDGFGIANNKGIWQKVPQLGGLIIEDDVEIGANTTIDRGAIDNTVIEKGVKLDNLIQVGHNVRIGENTAVAACVGISGSTTIGKNCLVGGQSGFAGHLTIADQVVITGGTEVSKSIREPGVYSSGIGGVVTNQEWRKNSARVLRLEKLLERIKNLEELINVKK